MGTDLIRFLREDLCLINLTSHNFTLTEFGPT